MTNTEKYLKDSVSVEEFVNEFHNFCAKQSNNNASSIRLEQFLSRKATPTLTEDERAILRNLIEDKYIARDKDGNLFIFENEPTKEDINFGYDGYLMDIYNHLFPFIKKRRNV